MHVVELASNLGRMGHPVHVIARRIRKDEKETEVADGFTIHRVYRWVVSPGHRPKGGSADSPTGSPLSALYYIYLRTFFALYVSIVASRIIRKNRIDAIVERETAFGAGGLASVLARRPMILEIVGPRYSRLSARRSSEILFYTESMLRKWVDRTKCRPVEAGVNTRVFYPDPSHGKALRRSLGFSDVDLVVGYVGSFQSWHGVDTLLLSVSGMKARASNLKLLLAGPSSERFRSLAETLGLAESCRFVGPLAYKEVPPYINACDLMVAPYEPGKDRLRKRYGIGWPLKILEYMACGKPVVTTGVPPIDRIVKENETGLLVMPGDAKQLGEAILRLGDDRGLSEIVSRNGLSLVVSRYSWESVAARFSSAVQEA